MQLRDRVDQRHANPKACCVKERFNRPWEFIPGSPFVIRTNLPTELQVKLRSALLEIKNVRFRKLGVIISMDPGKDEDYNIVREWVPLRRRLKQKNK